MQRANVNYCNFSKIELLVRYCNLSKRSMQQEPLTTFMTYKHATPAGKVLRHDYIATSDIHATRESYSIAQRRIRTFDIYLCNCYELATETAFMVQPMNI